MNFISNFEVLDQIIMFVYVFLFYFFLGFKLTQSRLEVNALL